MTGRIYLVQDSTLLQMAEAAYDSEDLLQRHLADYPDLLAGDQLGSLEPRRWVLIAREMSLPGDDTGVDRWSVDHLFLDQDGVPTIVEVKRSTDTRIRREVVGQMLEYAANAVVYWPAEELRRRFEENCTASQQDPDQSLMNLVGDDGSPDEYWKTVKTNLQAGRVRMIFVADQIPTELRRIVEFLSNQLDPAEVFAIELKQFIGQGVQALVPRVVGNSAARQVKNGAPVMQWAPERISSELSLRFGQVEADIFERIVAWAKARTLRPWCGKGKKDASYMAMLDVNGQHHWTFAVWTYGSVAIQFGWMIDDIELKQGLLQRLNAIPGVWIDDDKLTRLPSFPLGALAAPDALKQFFSAFDWYVEQLRATDASTNDA